MIMPTSGQFIHEQIVAWKMRNGIATTGAEALMPAESGEGRDPYPLAIIDLQMPDMDGMALAREIKADPKSPTPGSSCSPVSASE